MEIRWRLGVTTASALMVVMTFPPISWWGPALLAWSPFFLIVRESSPRRAFSLGLMHGGIVYTLSLTWFLNIFSLGAVALWFLLALFTAIWGWLYSQLHAYKFRFIPLLGTILFVGLEYFRGELFFLSFPWITPGTALPPNLLTPIFGTYGVTFLVVLSGLLLIEPGKKTELSGLAIALGVLLAILMTPNKVEPSGTPVKVALVQSEDLKFENYLTQSSIFPGVVDIIVWPEYALKEDPQQNPEIIEKITALLHKRAHLLIAGGPTWHDPDSQDWSNTAFSFTKDGILATHFKNYPIPFSNDGKAGTEAKSFSFETGRIGTPICYDCDHQRVVREMTADGAQLFFVPTMNKIKWSERQHLQHGVHSRHRAAESGRWFAVASTSGLTQIIDPYGNVVDHLPLIESDTLIGQVYFENRDTIFVKFGWLFGLVITGCALLILLLILWKIRNQYREYLLQRDQKIRSLNANIKKSDSHSLSPKSFYD